MTSLLEPVDKPQVNPDVETDGGWTVVKKRMQHNMSGSQRLRKLTLN